MKTNDDSTGRNFRKCCWVKRIFQKALFRSKGIVLRIIQWKFHEKYSTSMWRLETKWMLNAERVVDALKLVPYVLLRISQNTTSTEYIRSSAMAGSALFGFNIWHIFYRTVTCDSVPYPYVCSDFSNSPLWNSARPCYPTKKKKQISLLIFVPKGWYDIDSKCSSHVQRKCFCLLEHSQTPYCVRYTMCDVYNCFSVPRWT